MEVQIALFKGESTEEIRVLVRKQSGSEEAGWWDKLANGSSHFPFRYYDYFGGVLPLHPGLGACNFDWFKNNQASICPPHTREKNDIGLNQIFVQC